MAKQTFTTGQVLTAAQMTSLQQTAMGGGSATAKTASYTLVAADAGTVIQMNSASATTITVNTALFAAGDSVQIQNIGAGVCTVTAGTATVTTAGSLALSQWEGGQLYFSSTSASIFFDLVQSAAAGGKVLQVVSFTTGTTDTSTSRTFANSSLTLNITPTLATSKVLVMVSQNGVSKSAAAASNDVKLKLVRGATDLGIFADNALYTNTAIVLNGMSFSFSYLDSPATTSATTYKTQFALGNGNVGPIYCQLSNELSSITLMEIGA
jgi:hypothetical protein